MVWLSVLYSVDKMTKITQWWIFKNFSLLLAGARWCVRSLHICVHMWMCICMYVCMHLWGVFVSVTVCVCMYVCALLLFLCRSLMHLSQHLSRFLLEPLEVTQPLQGTCLDVAEWRRKYLLLLALSLISHFSVPRVTLMVRKEVILSHCLPQRFVLRRLIFSGRINSSPRWSLKATLSRYVCGLLCDLRVCPQGFSHVLFWLQKSSVPAMQKGSNTEVSRGGTASADPRTAQGTAKSPWEWQLT